MILFRPFCKKACFRAFKNAYMNNSRSDLVFGSSIKQERDTELIPKKFTFRIKVWICFYMLSCVSFFDISGEFSLLNAILLITT